MCCHRDSKGWHRRENKNKTQPDAARFRLEIPRMLKIPLRVFVVIGEMVSPVTNLILLLQHGDG